jgi:hypothetical protein
LHYSCWEEESDKGSVHLRTGEEIFPDWFFLKEDENTVPCRFGRTGWTGVGVHERMVIRGSMNVHQRVHDRGKKEHNRDSGEFIVSGRSDKHRYDDGGDRPVPPFRPCAGDGV